MTSAAGFAVSVDFGRSTLALSAGDGRCMTNFVRMFSLDFDKSWPMGPEASNLTRFLTGIGFDVVSDFFASTVTGNDWLGPAPSGSFDG